jgi:hypothetical protein
MLGAAQAGTTASPLRNQSYSFPGVAAKVRRAARQDVREVFLLDEGADAWATLSSCLRHIKIRAPLRRLTRGITLGPAHDKP